MGKNFFDEITCPKKTCQSSFRKANHLRHCWILSGVNLTKLFFLWKRKILSFCNIWKKCFYYDIANLNSENRKTKKNKVFRIDSRVRNLLSKKDKIWPYGNSSVVSYLKQYSSTRVPPINYWVQWKSYKKYVLSEMLTFRQMITLRRFRDLKKVEKHYYYELGNAPIRELGLCLEMIL